MSRISAPTYHHQRQHSLPFRPSQYQPPSSYLPRTSSSDHPHHPHHHQQTLSFTSTEPTLLAHDPSNASSSGFISGTQSSSVLLQKPQIDQTLTTDDAHFLRHQQLRSSSRTREPFVEPSSYEEQMLGSPFDLDLPPPPLSSGDPDGADDTAAADIDRLRRESLRWRHWQTWTLRDRNAYLLPPTVATPQPMLPRAVLEQTAAESTVVVPLSSSAPTYGSILGGQHYHSYREPRSSVAARGNGNGNGSGSMSIEAMEARCAQLRQEFANFRQRQAALEAQRRETRSVLSQKAEEAASRTGGSRSGGSGLYEGEGPGGYATIVGGSSSSTSNEFESAC